MALATLLAIAAAPFVGSFLGVVVERLPGRRPILLGRSACDRCGAAAAPARPDPARELARAARALRLRRGATEPVLPDDRARGARGRALGRERAVRLAAVGEPRPRLDAPRAGRDRSAPLPPARRPDPAADPGRARGRLRSGSRAPAGARARRARSALPPSPRSAGPIAGCAGARGSGWATPSCSRRRAPGSAGRRCRASW